MKKLPSFIREWMSTLSIQQLEKIYDLADFDPAVFSAMMRDRAKFEASKMGGFRIGCGEYGSAVAIGRGCVGLRQQSSSVLLGSSSILHMRRNRIARRFTARRI